MRWNLVEPVGSPTSYKRVCNGCFLSSVFLDALLDLSVRSSVAHSRCRRPRRKSKCRPFPQLRRGHVIAQASRTCVEMYCRGQGFRRLDTPSLRTAPMLQQCIHLPGQRLRRSSLSSLAQLNLPMPWSCVCCSEPGITISCSRYWPSRAFFCYDDGNVPHPLHILNFGLFITGSRVLR